MVFVGGAGSVLTVTVPVAVRGPIGSTVVLYAPLTVMSYEPSASAGAYRFHFVVSVPLAGSVAAVAGVTASAVHPSGSSRDTARSEIGAPSSEMNVVVNGVASPCWI